MLNTTSAILGELLACDPDGLHDTPALARVTCDIALGFVATGDPVSAVAELESLLPGAPYASAAHVDAYVTGLVLFNLSGIYSCFDVARGLECCVKAIQHFATCNEPLLCARLLRWQAAMLLERGVTYDLAHADDSVLRSDALLRKAERLIVRPVGIEQERKLLNALILAVRDLRGQAAISLISP
jgi:hypothetical protein